MPFATPADVYAFGLPAAAFKSTPRTIEATDSTAGVLTLSTHGLASGSLLRFSVEGQGTKGAPVNNLPGGLSLSTVYTAAPYQGSSDLLQVAPVGGSLIASFSKDPVGPFAIVPDVGSVMAAQLDLWTGVIEDAIITSTAPIMPDPITGKYHRKLVLACAHLTARLFATVLGLANPNYENSMRAFLEGPIAKMVDGWLAEWRAGVPLIPTPLDATPAIADNGPLASFDYLSTPWLNGGVL